MDVTRRPSYLSRPMGSGTPGVAWDAAKVPPDQFGLKTPLFWGIYFTRPCGFVYRLETRKTLRGALGCRDAVAHRLARRKGKA